MRRNPLLAKPPTSHHRLGVRASSRAARILGRAVIADDYFGVHTSGSEMIAAAYAMGTWGWHARAGYPVLISIDVTGLTPEPDVDAMVAGAEVFDDQLRRELAGRLENGETFAEMLDDETFAEMQDASAGDDPAAFIFEEIGQRPLHAIDAYAAEVGEEPELILSRWIETRDLPSRVIQILVDQQRYMVDIGLDRVVKIEALRPWWPHVLFGWDEPEAEELIGLGWRVFTLEDWPNLHLDRDDSVTLYERKPGPDARVEYHGTDSIGAREAFPGLLPKKSPLGKPREP